MLRHLASPSRRTGPRPDWLRAQWRRQPPPPFIQHQAAQLRGLRIPSPGNTNNLTREICLSLAHQRASWQAPCHGRTVPSCGGCMWRMLGLLGALISQRLLWTSAGWLVVAKWAHSPVWVCHTMQGIQMYRCFSQLEDLLIYKMFNTFWIKHSAFKAHIDVSSGPAALKVSFAWVMNIMHINLSNLLLSYRWTLIS